MKAVTANLEFKTKGENDVVNLTEMVMEFIEKQKTVNGLVTIFALASTAAVTVMEYEPGLVKDFPAMLERIAPKTIPYEHHKTWHDDNGRSHVKSSLVGPSLTIPLVSGRLALGTWQQVVFIELDTKPRSRKVIVQVMGGE